MPFPNGEGFPGENRMCIVVNGAAGAVLENISFSDVHVTYEGGGTAEEAARRDVPQIAGEYFQIGTPPAYGIFARGVRGLSLNNIRLEVTKPDLRPAVVFDHVTDVAVNGLSAQGNPQAESLLRVIDSKDTLLTACRVLTPSAVFLQLEGKENEGITVDGGDISKAAAPLAAKAGADEKAAKLRV
jgi:hypothetical protein